MSRKYGRSMAYDDDDDDYDDYYSDDEPPVSKSAKPAVKAAAAAAKPIAKPVVSSNKPAVAAAAAVGHAHVQQPEAQSSSKPPKSGANAESSQVHKAKSKLDKKAEQSKQHVSAGDGGAAPVAEDLARMDLDSGQKDVGEGGGGGGAKQQGLSSGTKLNLDDYVPEPWVLEAIKAERKPVLHLIVMGHVDAGKSTLMGHILHLLGRVSKQEMHRNEVDSKQKGKGSFAYAWVLDEGSEERNRGVTMTVAVAHYETPKFRVVLLDAPGHKDLVPNMISGAVQADAAVLVIDATLGGFEAGLSNEGRSSGQTREHAQLVRSLGVEQLIVAVNKIDSVDYSQERYDFIKDSLRPFLKQCGFRDSAIRWIPVSAMEGQNLIAPPSAAPLKSWYSGPTLLECVDLFGEPLRNTSRPLRLTVAELVKGTSLGQTAVSGKLESGAIRSGSKVLVMPGGELATIRSIEQEGKAVNLALAGDSVDVGLAGVDPGALITGGILCHPDYPVPVASKLEVKILILGITVPVLRGAQVVLHAHHAREAVKVTDIVALLDSKTGAVTKSKPRRLIANQSALIELVPERTICLEEYGQFKALGRIALRDGGRTLAVGVVTKILSTARSADGESYSPP